MIIKLHLSFFFLPFSHVASSINSAAETKPRTDGDTLHSCLMEAFRQGNFQMASSGYRVCGTDCLVKPLSQGRVSTSCWLSVILLPSPLNLLRLGCMQVSQPRFRVTIILTLSTRAIKCNLLLIAYKITWFEGVSLRLALTQL